MPVRQPRRICKRAECGAPCRRPANVYCSEACFNADRRRPRRICKRSGCGTRCKRAEHVYCSDACRLVDTARPRPLCPVCRERPCSPQGATCGREFGCAGTKRAQTVRAMVGPRRFRAGLEAMWTRSREAATKRMAEYLKTEIAAIDAASTPLERAKIAARIYRKGYQNGASAAYQRYVVQPRAQAQKRSA